MALRSVGALSSPCSTSLSLGPIGLRPLREGTFFFLYRRAFICGPESTGHMVSAQKTVTAVTTVEESFKEKRNEWIKGRRD